MNFQIIWNKDMKPILLSTIMFWNLILGCSFMHQCTNKAKNDQDSIPAKTVSHDSLRVVMMGNSITELWAEIHPDFFKANNLVGRGISGQVSAQMLIRFRHDVINLKPDVVVINCGTNDIAENDGPYNEDITMDNIQSMTELALNHDIEVVLTSVLPCDGFLWNHSVKDSPEKIDRLNKRIKEYTSDKPRVHYIDYFSSMTSDGRSMNKNFTEDGVHPNANGYDVMEVKLKEMLNTLNR